MSKANLEINLASCVNEILNEKKVVPVKVNPPCYCVVRFYDEEMIESFTKAVRPLFGEFIRHDEYLFKLCDSFDTANILSRNIDSLIYRFDKTLISVPFEPEWLDAFFSQKGFGIDIAMTSDVGMKESEISSYVEKKRKDVIGRNSYKLLIKSNLAAAAVTTPQDIAKSFADFLSSNWEGFVSSDQAITLVDKLISFCEEFSVGRYQIPAHSSQTIMIALADKARYLESQREQKNSDIRMDWYSTMDAVVKKSDFHGSWDSLRKSLAEMINNETKSISPKDFCFLLKDENAVIEIQKPFEGIDFSHDIECDMNKRLSPSNLRYDVQEQGGTLNFLLAGAVAAYYLKVCELKQVAKLEKGLIELSKNLDAVDVTNALNDVILNSIK